MPDTRKIDFKINYLEKSAEVETRLTLADFLRHELLLTGTHVGCEHGVCGACTVLVNGLSVRACLMMAVQIDGAEVHTVESLAQDGKLNVLQQAFQDHHGLQCGFCTPGMLLTAQDLARKSPQASREEIREHIAGNLCRCTGYQAIVDAVESVMRKRCEAAADGNSRHD